MSKDNRLYTDEEGKEIFINAFSTSAEKNIKALSGVEIILETAEVLPQTRIDRENSVYGVLVVPFENIGNVTISISFSPNLIFKIVENFLDEKYSKINDDVTDAVGELTNLITVQAKTIIKKMGIDFSMTIPYVNVVGPKTEFNGPHKAPVLSMSYQSNFGSMFIELSAKTSRISDAFKGPEKVL